MKRLEDESEADSNVRDCLSIYSQFLLVFDYSHNSLIECVKELRKVNQR